MRHIILAAVLLLSFSLPAQTIKKADKEFELGNFVAAVAMYQKIAIKDSNNGDIAGKLGDCYRILNQLDTAEKWYRKAAQISGSSSETLLNLGHVQKMQGKYAEAKASFDRFALAQPGIGKHFSATCEFAELMAKSPSPYVVRPEYLNNETDDFFPVPYESHVVFSTTRSENGNSDSHLVISSLDQNNYLKPPTPLRTLFDQTSGQGPVSYSTESNTVVFAKNNFKNGLRLVPESGMKMSLYYGVLDGDGGWTEILPFPYNGSGFSTGFPSLSKDGKTLFFASDRPDGYGGYDIFVSRKIGNTWTKPENLGPKVNTQGNEISPFFDGNTLYFSSDWHNGLGGFDIFKAQRSEAYWDRIFHLGNEVNSGGDDLGFVIHPVSKISYFASNRPGGKGNYDLYRAIRQTDEMTFAVKDGQGNPIENAIIDLAACEEGNYRTDASGVYSFQALGGFTCDIVISKTGYAQELIVVNSDGQQKTQTFDIVLRKEAEKLVGVVVNTSTNKPESDVLIKATNQNSGSSLETYSAQNGSYALALQPNSFYVIRYTKVGFTDTHNRIKTEGTIDRNILGTINLEPVYGIANNSPKNDVSTIPNSNGNYGNPAKGFSIQVAAADSKSQINLDNFKQLAGVGQVYVVQEKGLSKVRVGSFKTRAAADAAKRNIARQGFSEAFVVSGGATSSNGQPEATTVATPIERPKPPVFSTPKTTSTESNSTHRENNKYKIRLATYKNTSYFKPEKVLSWGSIEKVKSGELTIMLLASFDSLYEAKQVMEKVRKAGFKTAHVVLDKNGKLIRQQ